MTALLNKHAPVQHKQVVEHPIYPWYTSQILEQIHAEYDNYRGKLINTEIYHPAPMHTRLQEISMSGCYSWQRGNPLMTSLSHSVAMQGKSLTLWTIFLALNKKTLTSWRQPTRQICIILSGKNNSKSEMGLITFLHINHNHTPILSITLLILHHSQMKMSIT